MLTHFDDAFTSQDHLPSVVVENDLGDDDGLLDIAAASSDVEAPNHPSDDEDGLYDENVSPTSQPADEELGDDDDAAVSSDGDFSWRIEHTTGDHKLKGMFSCLTSAIRTLTLAS